MAEANGQLQDELRASKSAAVEMEARACEAQSKAEELEKRLLHAQQKLNNDVSQRCAGSGRRVSWSLNPGGLGASLLA